MAVTSTAVKLRRLRQRFGIRAPKVAIRTHVAWYWRGGAIVLLLSLSLALAAWVYDAGRSIAGFDSRSTSRELTELKDRIVELDAELSVVRGVASAADSNLKIERVAQQQLAQQVRLLESENSALKQDLAFFEGLLPDNVGGEQGVRINRFRIESDGASGQRRYRLLVIHNASRQQKEFRGELQFVLKVQQGGKDVMITVPSETDSDKQRYKLEVKHFQRAEGILPVPPGAILKSVEARILQDGVVRVRQTVNL
ncbi:MAG: hypothetical protein IPL58_07040 [Betaproteobacteria bacterium]|jgi:hypothetical protein|uniref:Uncharacterized protein n=1 Tax=Candidatus Proximibacter danicus TaxID=2954365 RepID=A0A9D7PQ06_9PROT|nr:hypothetical protein [Candidatus Proximibacter danicus]MBK9444976.1 hypothetical protein [Betaproteobacteria bacterium]